MAALTRGGIAVKGLEIVLEICVKSSDLTRIESLSTRMEAQHIYLCSLLREGPFFLP